MSYGGEDRRQLINGVGWGLTAGSITVVILRIASRLSTRNLGFDDYLILPAVVMQIAYVAVLSAATSHGYGMHMSAISPPEEATTALYFSTISKCLAVLTFALPKLAIVALLERLLSLSRPTRIIFWAMAVSLLALCVALSVFWYAQCTPRPHQWDPKNVPGTCWNPRIILDYSYYIGAYSAFLDLFWAVFPPFIIWKLQMPLVKKVAISTALGGGILACAVTIYKCTLLYQVGAASRDDPTWADVPLLVFTATETNVLIMAASLPTIGPFLRLFREKSSTLYRKSGRSSNNNFRNNTNENHDKPNVSAKIKAMFSSTGTIGKESSQSQDDDIHLVDIERRTTQATGNKSWSTLPTTVHETVRGEMPFIV